MPDAKISFLDEGVEGVVEVKGGGKKGRKAGGVEDVLEDLCERLFELFEQALWTGKSKECETESSIQVRILLPKQRLEGGVEASQEGRGGGRTDLLEGPLVCTLR